MSLRLHLPMSLNGSRSYLRRRRILRSSLNRVFLRAISSLAFERRIEDSCLTARDVYNLRRKLHVEFLAGRTPLQALLIELPRDGEWIFKHEVDDENHVTALFCMHKSSIAMLRTNSWVISMDSTYKTNRYGLPLLNIVGFAATGQAFTSASPS